MTALNRTLVVASLAALVAAGTGPAAAQTAPAQSFEQFQGTVPLGTTLTIHDEAGNRKRGRLSVLSDTEIAIDATDSIVPRRYTFNREHIAKITRTDSNKDGFWIGFVAGAVPGLMLGHGITQYCYNEASHCPEAYAVLGTLLGAAGGWIGASIDAAIDGGPVVYSANRTASGPRVRPFVTADRRGAGVALSVGF